MSKEEVYGLLGGLLIASPCCVIIYLLLYDDFQKRDRSNDPHRVTSFFDLKEIVQGDNLRVYASLYAFVISLSLWVLCGLLCVSDRVGAEIKSFLQRLIDDFSDLAGAQAVVNDAGNLHLPVSISLFIIVAIVSLTFLPHVMSAFKILKRIAHIGIGFDDTCENLIRRSALDVQHSLSDDEIQLRFSSTAVPRELSGANQSKILEYRLLCIGSEEAPQDGMLLSLRRVLLQNGVPTSLEIDPPPLLNIATISVFAAFYFLVATLYCALLPKIGSLLCGSSQCKLPLIGPVDFPNAGLGPDPTRAFRDLSLEVCQFSFQVALPFWIGLALYDRRQRSASGASSFADDFVPVAGLQIAMSLGAGLLFSVILLVYSWASDASPISLISVQRVLDVLLPCSVAPISTYVWSHIALKRGKKELAILTSAVSAGVLYGIVGFCYGCFCNNLNALFVEGSALSFYLIFACGTLWGVTYNRQPRQLADPV